MGNARIVQLKSGHPGPCLFIIPGLGGRTEGLVNLAALLRTSMPVFAIEARGVQGTNPPDTQIEEMARHYLSRVKTVQAAGPYFLAGHSSGGLVAFEMARRLVEAKERVGCLILLDTGLSKRYWPLRYYLKILGTQLYRHLKMILKIPAEDKPKYIIDNCRKLLRNFQDPYGLKRLPINVTIADRIAGDRYRPKFYSGKVIFFRATIKEIPADPDFLWRNRVHELEVRSVTGGHNTMLDLPYVSALAVDISACIAQQSG
jgi:acetoacetyl-CoA synthetase